MDPSGSIIISKLRGEAVTVDLGEGRFLFALLRSQAEMDWAKQVMFLVSPSVRSGSNADYEAQHRQMLQQRDEIVLPPTYRYPGAQDRPARPMLVTFDDIGDPTSVAEVDPDDLAASFGEGVTLQRITVQLTGDPVTTGVEDRLSWLADIGRTQGSLSPNESRFLSDALPVNLVAPSDFSTELYK